MLGSLIGGCVGKGEMARSKSAAGTEGVSGRYVLQHLTGLNIGGWEDFWTVCIRVSHN